MSDLNSQRCFHFPRGAGLRLALKTRLSEVLVECKRGLELHASHYSKRNAVGEGESFVVVLLEPFKPCREVFRANVQQNDGGAGAQAMRDGLSASVIETSADQGERLIKHIRSNNERLRTFLEQPPERKCLLVILIVRVFQRQYETGVEQGGRQVLRSYRYSSCRAERSVTPLWPGLEPSSKTGSSAAGMGYDDTPGLVHDLDLLRSFEQALRNQHPIFFHDCFHGQSRGSQNEHCTPPGPIGGGRRKLVVGRRQSRTADPIRRSALRLC